VNAFYRDYPMPARRAAGYAACDLLSDVLSRGKSARLYRVLVKERQLCSSVNAYITGDQDPGMFVITGQLVKGVTHAQALAAVEELLDELKNEAMSPDTLEKLHNNVVSTLTFAETQVLNVAMNLGYYALLGDAGQLNREADHYRSIDAAQLQAQARQLFVAHRANTLYYHAR
jgi:predicted Zn-dependent peptidase